MPIFEPGCGPFGGLPDVRAGTGDDLVRQASYKGIELEKDPRKVIRERPKA